MTTEGLKQKLTAILSADVKDYSRLLSQDRVNTINTLNAHRDLKLMFDWRNIPLALHYLISRDKTVLIFVLGFNKKTHCYYRSCHETKHT